MFLIVNFGGPRDIEEVAAFLTELLTDRDVIRTWWPDRFHKWFFTRIARKRAEKIKEDYHSIGGRSPIYEDTEKLAKLLSEELNFPVLTFHRYLPATHASSLQKIISAEADMIRVIPLFPQFSYATTGSIARFLKKNLPDKTLKKLKWIPSYEKQNPFIEAHVSKIRHELGKRNLIEQNVALLFSAHGLPQAFVDGGDPYQEQCIHSYDAIRSAFPKAIAKLSYQSKFGRGEWLRPYTDETCEEALQWNPEKREVLVIPLSFTSDHIETLFEIEQLYLPVLRKQGMMASRCPALNLDPQWIKALATIAIQAELKPTEALILET